MKGGKRKARKKSSDNDADYIPRALTSEEVKAERKRACGRKYYAQHPEYKEAKRLRMQIIRQGRKLARRRWDPPKPSGYAADADERLDEEEDGYEASITAPTPCMGPSPTVSEIVGESYNGQLPTLWQKKLDEIQARERGEAGEREESEVEKQLREKETIASHVLSSLYKVRRLQILKFFLHEEAPLQTSVMAQPPTPSFAALAATSPLPPSSPPPLSTPDLDFAPRAAGTGDWTSSPMTSLPIATPSPVPPPRRRQADPHGGRKPLPRWKTPEYDGPDEMPPFQPRDLFSDFLKARQADRRAGRG
ncbi:hypothetical protein R3P38DRAFT_3236164 [Favolaschia claudopus]|uniref:Uncharacterized protein n=1 Tax=Favolaschia claudopus TaxID=2862362 RepID=A0AAV9ZD37_9AGAR